MSKRKNPSEKPHSSDDRAGAFGSQRGRPGRLEMYLKPS